jgi:hypothetical protein
MDIPPHDPNLVVSTDGFFDPDASNGLRARSAYSAVLDYQEKRGLDSDEHVCAIDLLTHATVSNIGVTSGYRLR